MEKELVEIDTDYRSLTKIMQFRLNRETENLRDDFFKSVVITGLLNGASRWITKEEISNIMCSKYSVCKFPTSTVEHYLKEMIKEKEVSQENGKYALSKYGKKKYLKQNGNRAQTEKAVFGRLLRYVEERYGVLPDSQKDLVKNSFREFLARFFTARGQDVVSIFFSERGSPRIDAESFFETLDKALDNLQDKKLQEAQREAICALMTAPDTEVANFLGMALQKYVYFEVMDLDPRCRALEKEALSRKKVFLDTNVIFDLVFETEERHLLIEEMVRLTRDMNIKMVFTERTREEFLRVMAKATKRYNEWSSRVSEKTIKKMLPFESGVVKSYYKDKESKPALTFDSYAGSLEKGFDRMLAENYGIELDSRSYIGLSDDDYLKTLGPQLDVCARKNFQFKDTDVIEHDAFHLALISELRKGEENDFLGPKNWFVTNDDSLYCVSKELISEGKERSPLSVRSDVWLQALTIFLPLSTLRQDFAEIWKSFMKFCCSPYARSLPTIDNDRLFSFAGSWMDVDWLTAEDIAEITSNTFVNEYLHKPQDTESSPSVIMPPIVNKKVTDKIDRLKEEIERVKKERDAALHEKEELQKDKEASRRRTRLALFIPGMLCVIAILLLALIGNYRDRSVPDVAFWCLTIMAVVFIASSVFGRKIFEALSIRLPR